MAEEPAIYRQAREAYRLMAEYSQLENLDGKVIRVYEGHLTRLITHEMGLSNPYYTKITRVLRATGAAEMLQRGGGGANSKWVLHHEPTQEMIEHVIEAGGGTLVTTKQRSEIASLEQQVRDLVGRINALEDRILILDAEIRTLKGKAA